MTLQNFHVAIHILCFQYDSTIVIKSEPVILEGGYEQWLLFYPMMSTNPRVTRPSPVQPASSVTSCQFYVLHLWGSINYINHLSVYIYIWDFFFIPKDYKLIWKYVKENYFNNISLSLTTILCVFKKYVIMTIKCGTKFIYWRLDKSIAGA